MNDPESFDELLAAHPELGETGEQLTLVTEKTKSDFYNLIVQKVGTRPDGVSIRSKKFETSDGLTLITASLFKPGTRRNGPKLAAIKSRAKSDIDGKHIQTGILVIDAPDGIQFCKQTTVIEPGRQTISGIAIDWQSPLSPNAMDFGKEIQAKLESEQLETALGVNFVTEQEAQELMTTFASSQPIAA